MKRTLVAILPSHEFFIALIIVSDILLFFIFFQTRTFRKTFTHLYAYSGLDD